MVAFMWNCKEVGKQVKLLLVGYHMLMGLELSSLVERFLSEKNIMEGAAPKYCTRALSKKDLQEFPK
jgi:hypothetical protein